MSLEFVDPEVQADYDDLKEREDSLISELEDVQESIREIEANRERL